MAVSELTLKFTWEDDVEFKLTSKRDAGPVKTVVALDENGNIAALWPHVRQLIETYVSKELGVIGGDMGA